MQIRISLAAALAVLTALPGCTQAPPPRVVVIAPAGTGEGKYDLIGQSATCAPAVIQAVPQPQGGSFGLAVGGDGGWCGLRLSNGGKPYDAGLLHVSPQHGVVFIHRVATFTRIDYTPDAGYVGPDSFLVRLLPGYVPVQVQVTASASAAPPAAARPPAAKP